MFYTKSPYTANQGYLFSHQLPRLSKPVRINIRTLKNIPMWCTLVVRNGCPVRYRGGYLTPIRKHRFTSIQEANGFLHTEGRKGLFQVTRFSDWWEITECVQMYSKKQAFEKAAENWFGYIFSWKKNNDIFF